MTEEKKPDNSAPVEIIWREDQELIEAYRRGYMDAVRDIRATKAERKLRQQERKDER